MSQTVFITGATRGLGLEFTRQFCLRKFKVIAAGRNAEKSADLLKLKRDFENNLVLVNLDVSSEASIAELPKKLSGETIDILINNAGILPKGETAKDILDSFTVNSLAPFLITKELMPLVQKSSKPRIAHLTSLMGSIEDNQSGGYYAYRMSKAALNMMNKSLSIDFPKVTSIVLNPGWVQTDMGGSGAKLTPEESVSGLRDVIEKLTLKQTGRFFNYDGHELPW